MEGIPGVSYRTCLSYRSGASYRKIGRLGILCLAYPIVCLHSGCQGGFPLRWPMASPEQAAAQRQEAERFDPFPDMNVGPADSLRPRDGQVQRSEPRRIRENSIKSQGVFPGSPNGMYPPPTEMSSPYEVVPP